MRSWILNQHWRYSKCKTQVSICIEDTLLYKSNLNNPSISYRWSLHQLDDYNTWETRYVLLLWFSLIIIIPFDLSRIDSSKVFISVLVVIIFLSSFDYYIQNVIPWTLLFSPLLSSLLSSSSSPPVLHSFNRTKKIPLLYEQYNWQSLISRIPERHERQLLFWPLEHSQGTPSPYSSIPYNPFRGE